MSRDVKIALYNGNTPKSKMLTSVAGIAVLDNYCTFCKVKEDLSNGNYELDATFIIDHKNIHKEIKEESILKVKVDYGYEIFRITKVTLGKKYIDVFARQITIQDQLNLFLSDVRPTDQQGISALRHMIENSNEYKEGKQYARDLEFSSNIENLGTAYYQNMNLYEALFDCDQSFINRWGGEIQRRGYKTIIDRKIGQDRGFQVREGKNLTGFEALTNIDSVVTRIKPIGYDGITIDGYVQSGLIDKYSTVKTRKIKYDNVKVKGENDDEGFNTLEEAQAELIRLAKLEFTEKHIDEIEATYRINFIDLFKTEEYKDYAMLERVYLGDSVNVYIESLDIDITVRAITREYNVLSQEVVEIELSNVDLSKLKPISITEIIKEMDKLPDSMQGILEQARKEATDLINEGINGHVVVNKNEILIMDTADKNTATKLWRFNLNGIAHSSTGYNGQFNTAWTMDGKIVLSEATCEVINAILIKTGKITSANGIMVIDVDSGIITSGLNGYSTSMDRGGHVFQCTNENVGAIRSSSFSGDRKINGLSIVNFAKGDYLDLGYSDADNIQEIIDFIPMLRLCRYANPLTGNYAGIQLKHNIRVDNGRIFSIQSSTGVDHDLFSITGGHLGIFGDNGIKMGYKAGTDRISLLEVSEELDSDNCKIRLGHTLNMQGFSIRNVNQFYYSTGDVMGAVKGNATRVSNLNTFFESGWYACGSDCINTPEPWGIVHHFKAFSGDFAQWYHGTSNKLYIRWYVNKAWSAWKVW